MKRVPQVKIAVAVMFFFAIFGGIGTLCIYWSAVTLLRGEYPTALTVVALATFCFAFLAQFIIVKSRHVTLRCEVDAAGTLLRPDRSVDLLEWAAVLAVLMAMALYVIYTPLGKMDIPTPPGVRASYFVFSSIAGLLVGAPTLWRMIARGGKSSLQLSPLGFRLRAWSSVEAAWADVKDITDRRPGGRPSARGLVVIELTDGRAPLLEADAYTPDGRALRDMVRFYWRNPERRAELTDARALNRLRANAF